jgi:hypothetical protein
MKKSYMVLGLYFSSSGAIENEFHKLGIYPSEELAASSITKENLEYYDEIIIVLHYSGKER